MLGVFLLNKKGNICFVQDSRTEEDISAFRYAPFSRKVVAVFEDGREETFNRAVMPEMHGAFMKQKKILAVYLDVDDSVQREYEVPIKRVKPKPKAAKPAKKSKSSRYL